MNAFILLFVLMMSHILLTVSCIGLGLPIFEGYFVRGLAVVVRLLIIGAISGIIGTVMMSTLLTILPYIHIHIHTHNRNIK